MLQVCIWQSFSKALQMMEDSSGLAYALRKTLSEQKRKDG